MAIATAKGTVESTIYSMLTESTGAALCDSGSAYGRHWERNQKRSLEDFRNDPTVTGGENYVISVFHYLLKCGGLSLDDNCHEFNALPVDDWEGDYYGVSEAGQQWLDAKGFEHERDWNTYNYESSLSQVLQGTNLELDGEHYVLLQIHQGCDVRGGYTDARLFHLDYSWMGPEDVYGVVQKADGTEISVSNTYDGWNLADEDGNLVEITDDDKVELDLAEFYG